MQGNGGRRGGAVAIYVWGRGLAQERVEREIKPRSGAPHLRENEMRRHGGLARWWGPMRAGRRLMKSMPKAEIGAPDCLCWPAATVPSYCIVARLELALEWVRSTSANPRKEMDRRSRSRFVPRCDPSATQPGHQGKGVAAAAARVRSRARDRRRCGGRQRARSLYTPRASAAPTCSRHTAAVHAHSRFSPFVLVPSWAAPLQLVRLSLRAQQRSLLGVSGRLGIGIALCLCKVGGQRASRRLAGVQQRNCQNQRTRRWNLNSR